MKVSVATLVMFLFGILFLGLGFGKTYLNRLYHENSVQILATVTESTHVGAGTRVSSLIKYRFNLPSGEEVRGDTNYYSGEIGSAILVEYLADHPNWNRVAGSGEINKGWWLSMGCVGLFFFLAGIRLLAFPKRPPQA